MKTQLIKLNGGGRVLYTPVKGIQGVHVYLDFFAGSYNDPKGKLGVAHFCERILAGFDTKSRKKIAGLQCASFKGLTLLQARKI